MEQSLPQCQVCFTNSTPLAFHQTIIRCLKCKKPAHRYCYLPSCNSLQFICDACQNNYKGVCSICDNPGLLKKVNQQLYGHPVCLIFSHAFLVYRYSNLSFLKVDVVKTSKRAKCVECGLSNGSVISCGLSCNTMCHIYCALKSYNSTDSSGWRVCLHMCAGASSYFDIFESITNRAITNQYSFLKRKLPIGKISKNNLPVQIYCEQHSLRVIDCKCMDLDSEKDKWIYCDGCSRWQHLQCVEGAQATNAIEDNQLFLCEECVKWRHAIQQKTLEIPEQLPKLHIYDFILIQYRFQRDNYQISPHLLQYSLKLPLLPSQPYADTEYRKEIAKKFRAKIDLSVFRKHMKINKEENKYTQISKIRTVLIKEKELLLLIWFLCESNIVFDQQGKYQKFVRQFDEEIMDAGHVMDLIDLIINYQNRFIGTKPDEIKLFRESLQMNVHDQTTKSLTSYPNKSKQDHVEERNKVEKSICQQLKKWLGQLNNKSKTIQIVLQEVHKLINSPQITPYRHILPKIPIVNACIAFKTKEQALKYINGVSQIEQIKLLWKRLNNTAKISEAFSFHKTRDKFIFQADIIFKNIILNEKNSKLRTQLLKQWNRYSVGLQIPFKQCCLDEPFDLIATINDYNISAKKVKQTLVRYEQRRMLDLKDSQVSSYIKQLSVLEKLLTMVSQFKFTKRSLVRVKSFSNYCWGGQYTSNIPSILLQFQRLYTLTEKLLYNYRIIDAKDQLFMKGEEEICLFQIWEQCQLQIFDNQRNVERCFAYFKEIQGIRLHLFSQTVLKTLKQVMARLVNKFDQRTPIFQSETQYKILSKYCLAFQISPAKMNAIFEKDRKFVQRLNILKIQFDNLEMTEELDSLLTQHLPFCESNQLSFRVHQIRVLLTWIDLHKTILQKVPPQLLLSPQQAVRLDYKNPHKPDYFILRQIHNIMKKVQFPNCLFLERFTKLVQQGQIYNSMIDKVLDCCTWNYDLQASLDWDKKITVQQFTSIRQNIKNCNFYFQAEIIEFSIIKQKFDEAQIQAKMLIIQHQKDSEQPYFYEKARRLLTSLGCFPMVSQHTKTLWSIIQSPKLQGLPENLDSHIAEIGKTNRIYSWQSLQQLRQEIDNKKESKFMKKELCNRLSDMIAANIEFEKSYKPYYKKMVQHHQFSNEQLQAVEVLIKEYMPLQFQDECFEILKSRYQYFQIIKSHIKRNTKYPPSLQKVKDIQDSLLTVHPSFFVDPVPNFHRSINCQVNPNRSARNNRKEYSDRSDYSPQPSDISSFSVSNKKTGIHNKLGRSSSKKEGRQDISLRRDRRR